MSADLAEFERFAQFAHLLDGVRAEGGLGGDDDAHLTVEGIEDSDPLRLAEVLVLAHQNDYDIGPLDTKRSGGVVTIRP